MSNQSIWRRVAGALGILLAICLSATITVWAVSSQRETSSPNGTSPPTSANTSKQPNPTDASSSDAASPAATPSESPGYDPITEQLSAILQARYTLNPDNHRQRRAQLARLLPPNLVDYASSPLAGWPNRAIITVDQLYAPEPQDIPGSDWIYVIMGVRVRVLVDNDDPVYVLYRTASTWQPTGADDWDILSFDADSGVVTTNS